MTGSVSDFTVEVGVDRPWVTVWDPQGFRDEGCQAFLSFWASQDRGPRRLRREARELAAAWTWLRSRDQSWSTATLADWTLWAQAWAPDRLTASRMTHCVETLYRFYAFWHWYAPTRVRRQPWPTDPRERQRWALQIVEVSRIHEG